MGTYSHKSETKGYHDDELLLERELEALDQQERDNKQANLGEDVEGGRRDPSRKLRGHVRTGTGCGEGNVPSQNTPPLQKPTDLPDRISGRRSELRQPRRRCRYPGQPGSRGCGPGPGTAGERAWRRNIW